MTIDRRTLLKGTAAMAAAGALIGPFGARRAAAQATAPTGAAMFTPEEGASLRLLRWVPFVKGEEEAWNANTKAFTDATGVEVRIDQESWEDVRPKAAVAANEETENGVRVVAEGGDVNAPVSQYMTSQNVRYPELFMGSLIAILPTILLAVVASVTLDRGLSLGFTDRVRDVVLKSVQVGAGLPVFSTLLIGHMLIVLPYCVRVVGASLASCR